MPSNERRLFFLVCVVLFVPTGLSVTLTEKNVKRSKKREPNLSNLLDRLLADWLA